jgi:hypothetical protein
MRPRDRPHPTGARLVPPAPRSRRERLTKKSTRPAPYVTPPSIPEAINASGHRNGQRHTPIRTVTEPPSEPSTADSSGRPATRSYGSPHGAGPPRGLACPRIADCSTSRSVPSTLHVPAGRPGRASLGDRQTTCHRSTLSNGPGTSLNGRSRGLTCLTGASAICVVWAGQRAGLAHAARQLPAAGVVPTLPAQLVTALADDRPRNHIAAAVPGVHPN